MRIYLRLFDRIANKIETIKRIHRNSRFAGKKCSMCGRTFRSKDYWEVCPECYIQLTQSKETA